MMIGLQREAHRRNSVPPSLPVRIALLALRFYKTYLSILFAGNCRFVPSCSQYAYESIERFGLGRGVWLALKRLLRCQPLSHKFGYDPVPEPALTPKGSDVVAGPQTRAFSVAHRRTSRANHGYDPCEPVPSNSHEVHS